MEIVRRNFKLGAVQKLRNVQRGEGVDDFVTYRHVYFEGEGGILWNSYVTADTEFDNSKRAHTSIFSALWNHQNEKYRWNFVPNNGQNIIAIRNLLIFCLHYLYILGIVGMNLKNL